MPACAISTLASSRDASAADDLTAALAQLSKGWRRSWAAVSQSGCTIATSANWCASPAAGKCGSRRAALTTSLPRTASGQGGDSCVSLGTGLC